MALPNPNSRQFWPENLREYADQLEPPEAVYTTKHGGFRSEVVFACILLFIGIAAHGLYWFVLDRDGFQGKFWMKVGFVVLVFVPAFGVLALVLAWRARDQWVLIYATGILFWKRGVVTSFPWEEIQRILFRGVKSFDEPIIERDENGQVVGALLTVRETIFMRWGLRLLRNDGETAVISGYVSDFAELSRSIQERTFRQLWPDIWQRLQSGNECPFGIFRVSRAGLTDNRDECVPWDQVGKVSTDKSLQIRKVGRLRVWRTGVIWRLPNPHLLLTLIATRSEWAEKRTDLP